MLKFKVDENLPVEVAALLSSAGYDAATVADQQMVGQPDVSLAAICCQERRVMVALDLHFADIRAYPPALYSGIIVLRLARLDKPRVLSIMERLLPVLRQEPLTGKLWIVQEASIRMHG